MLCNALFEAICVFVSMSPFEARRSRMVSLRLAQRYSSSPRGVAEWVLIRHTVPRRRLQLKSVLRGRAACEVSVRLPALLPDPWDHLCIAAWQFRA